MDQASLPVSVGLLFSGGLDSAILLSHLLTQGHAVRPIYIGSGVVWEAAERSAARSYLAASASSRLGRLVELEMPVDDLYRDHWSISGRSTPDAKSPDEAVYLPGRNPLLLVKAAVWCNLHGLKALALAPLRTNPFPDSTESFFGSFQAAMNQALDSNLRIVKPFAHLDKVQVMRLGRGYPLERTFSCIAPVSDLHCGQCNKCAERRLAFASVDWPDPTPYFGQSRDPVSIP